MININLKNVSRVIYRNALTYSKLILFSTMFNFIEPLIYLTGMGFGLGIYVKEINGMSYAQFIAPAFIASTAMFAVTFECTYGAFTRMDYQKTYDAIISTPVNLEDVILAEIIWGAFKGVLYGSLILLLITFFGFVHSPAALLIIPVLFIAGLMFGVFAMILTSLVPGYEFFNYYMTLIITPMFMFSGIFFPLNSLPPAVQALANALPLVHLVNPCRELAMGHISGSIIYDLLYFIVLTVIFVALPLYLIKKRLVR